VKISDGCDRRCAFCAIPLIKGTYETVAPRAVLAAAAAALENAAARGVGARRPRAIPDAVAPSLADVVAALD